jgi:F0F1-type ATP synthase assembly protein I
MPEKPDNEDPERLPGDDDVDAKVAELQAKGREIRKRNPMPEPPEWKVTRPEGAKPASGPNYRGAGIGLMAAYALVGPVLLGIGIGYLIDKRTPGSHVGQTWGGIIGVIAGFVAFLVTLVRLVNTGPKQ